jgi:hypothetical protein
VTSPIRVSTERAGDGRVVLVWCQLEEAGLGHHLGAPHGSMFVLVVGVGHTGGVSAREEVPHAFCCDVGDSIPPKVMVGRGGGRVVSVCQGSDGSIDVPECSVVEVIVPVLVVPWLAVYVSQGRCVAGLMSFLSPCLGSQPVRMFVANDAGMSFDFRKVCGDTSSGSSDEEVRYLSNHGKVYAVLEGGGVEEIFVDLKGGA